MISDNLFISLTNVVLYTVKTLRFQEMNRLTSVVRFNILYPFRLTGIRKLKEQIRGLFEKEKKIFRSLDYIFCSDDYLVRINEDFLNHDDLTDIISFDLSDSGSPIYGEIYISVERVLENSKRFKVPFSTELRRVMFHGALHLCGYGDKTPAQVAEMRNKEDFFLELYK